MSDRVFALALSGLQDFVYDVEAQDAARRLRIRSALLTLAPEVAYITPTQQGRGTGPEPILILALLNADLKVQDLNALWSCLATEGWGKRRSVGYGAFELHTITEMQATAAANGFTLLGHCLPTDELPAHGLWRWAGLEAIPHDPETGQAIMPPMFTLAIRPGACFREKPVRQWVGRMLHHPLDKHPNYTRYGLAPAWPILWPD